MIIYPSIDTLLEKINSHYSLAVIAAKRAHEIEMGGPLLRDEYKSTKPLEMALEEIAFGDVNIDKDSIMSERDAESADEELKKTE